MEVGDRRRRALVRIPSSPPHFQRLGERLLSPSPWSVVIVPEPGIRAASQELIEELMGSVVALDFVLRTLMGLPADALPGEDRSEAIRELLVASACREVAAVGEEGCREATALIRTVIDRIADDVHVAGQLSEAGDQRPC